VLQLAVQSLAWHTGARLHRAKAWFHEKLGSLASYAEVNPVKAAGIVSKALNELVKDDNIKKILMEREVFVAKKGGGYEFDYDMAEKVILGGPNIRGKFLSLVAREMGGGGAGPAGDVKAEIVAKVGFRYLKLEERLVGRDFIAGITHAEAQHDALKRLGDILAEKFSGETGGSFARLLRLYRSDQSFKLKVDSYIRELAEVDKENFGFLQGVDPSRVIHAISELRSLELGAMEKIQDLGRGAVKAAPSAALGAMRDAGRAGLWGSFWFADAAMKMVADAVLANMPFGRDFMNAMQHLEQVGAGRLAGVEEQMKAMMRAGVRGV